MGLQLGPWLHSLLRQDLESKPTIPSLTLALDPTLHSHGQTMKVRSGLDLGEGERAYIDFMATYDVQPPVASPFVDTTPHYGNTHSSR